MAKPIIDQPVTTAKAIGNAIYSVTSAKVAQAHGLFEEIANSANEIDRLCFVLGGDPTNWQTAGLNIDIMRRMVAQIGWMADLGCKKLTGSEDVKGDAEQWMMSPVYVGTLEAAKEVSHA